jgi:hypothetical protein
MRDLGDDVFQRHRAHAVLAFQMALAGGNNVLCRRAMFQPGLHIGHPFQPHRVGQRLHGAAIGMAAHDDVAHAQRRHGIFHRGRNTAKLRAIAGHHVARVAAHEEVARLGLQNLFGHDARIRAGNHQRLGVLAKVGQLGNSSPLAGKVLFSKLNTRPISSFMAWVPFG